MLSILLFIVRRKLEIRGPVLNFEVQDSGYLALAEPSTIGTILGSGISKFKTGPRISNFKIPPSLNT